LKDYQLELTGSFPRRKPVIKHMVHSLGLLIFALILVGGGVGLFFLNRIGKADERLYFLGVESLGVMADVREEFVSLPTHMRNLIIEANPDRMGAYRDAFDATKGAVTDKLGRVGRMVAGDPEKEPLAKELDQQLAAYWAKADDCMAFCLANRKQAALQYMGDLAYPEFQASLQAMGFLQESMKGEVYSQLKSNGLIVASAKWAMAACIAAMAVLSVFFAVRIVRLT
jgi:hypothetical protein